MKGSNDPFASDIQRKVELVCIRAATLGHRRFSSAFAPKKAADLADDIAGIHPGVTGCQDDPDGFAGPRPGAQRRLSRQYSRCKGGEFLLREVDTLDNNLDASDGFSGSMVCISSSTSFALMRSISFLWSFHSVKKRVTVAGRFSCWTERVSAEEVTIPSRCCM